MLSDGVPKVATHILPFDDSGCVEVIHSFLCNPLLGVSKKVVVNLTEVYCVCVANIGRVAQQRIYDQRPSIKNVVQRHRLSMAMSFCFSMAKSSLLPGM